MWDGVRLEGEGLIRELFLAVEFLEDGERVPAFRDHVPGAGVVVVVRVVQNRLRHRHVRHHHLLSRLRLGGAFPRSRDG
jgi:hypothetical protein